MLDNLRMHKGKVALLLLGTSITRGMIWFNTQREALLQRIRIFRTDSATWGQQQPGHP